MQLLLGSATTRDLATALDSVVETYMHFKYIFEVLPQILTLFSVRLFSRCAIIIMRPHRHLMDPSTLEMLIMLRFNKDLWDAHA